MQTYSNRNKKLIYFPLLIVVAYLLLTLFLFAFGPIEWLIKNGGILYPLLMAYIAAFALGYFRGASKYKIGYDMPEQKEWDLFNFTRHMLPVAIIIFIIVSIRNYGYRSFNISGLINSIISGVGNMGGGYADKVSRISENLNGSAVFGGSLVTLFLYIWDFFDYNVLLLSIKYFKRGGLVHKILTTILCFMNVIYFVANGTNIGVFRILLAILLFYFSEKVEKKRQGIVENGKRLSFQKKLGIILLAVIAVVIFLSYFSSTMMSRGAYENGASQLVRFSGMQLRQVGNWSQIIPAGFYYLFLAFTSYCTQGYYGMSLALTEKWTPMFGLGSNMAIVNVLSQYFPNLAENTYVYKIQQDYHWSSKIQWSSFYTWIANDVSFFGVVFVMFLLGLVMARSFSDSINSRNPLATIVFYYTALICLFLPSNNQIGQNLATLFSMILAIIWWLRTRHGKPYNRIKFVLWRSNNAIFR